MNVIMLGPDLDVRGGISSIEKLILNNNFGDIEYIFIPTHKDYSKIGKLLFLFKQLTKFVAIITFQKNKIDLLYVHMSKGASFFRKSIFIMFFSIINKPIIIHMHSSEFDTFYNKSTKFVRKSIRFIINRSNRFVVLGEHWKSIYKKILHDENKLVVIYNSVDVPNKNPYNLNGRLITSLGVLCKKKGTFDILSVIPGIIDKFPDYRFVLAGSGDLEDAKEKIRELSLDTNVILPGWVNKSKKDEIFAETVLFLLPSYSEGLPMSVLEAMSHGIPVITTAVGGLPEVIENGVDGYLIEPGDINKLESHILELLNDKELRLYLSKNSYKKIKTGYNSKIFIKKLSEVITETIAVDHQRHVSKKLDKR